MNVVLPCGEYYQKLSFIIAELIFVSESLDDWQGKGDRLPRPRSVSGDEVFFFIDYIEGLILDWEKGLNALLV